jgi:anti-sigma B factor antagonist
MMTAGESNQLISPGIPRTVSLLQEHLNYIGAARHLALHLEELIAHHSVAGRSPLLYLDLKQIERISSAGLNELIGINSLARSRGIRLILLDAQESVREIFALTRLERMFEFHVSAAVS